MARINNTNRYPFDTNVTVEDFLIGSDAEISPDGKYLKTKNYKIGDIISLVPTENTDSFNYGYRYSNTVDVNTNPTYFTITGSDEQIENITSLTFNKVNSEGKDISDFFTSITGNESNIVFNITDGTEDNFGFFKPVAVTNPTTDTFNVTVTPIGSLQKGSLTEGQIYTSTFAVNGASGAGSTDYVSNVAFDGSNLNFTRVGNAFGSSVDLSSLVVDLTTVESPWDNVNGTPANQSSTNINHNGGNVGIGLDVLDTPNSLLHIKSNALLGTGKVFNIELQSGNFTLQADNRGSVWNQGLSDSTCTFFGLDAGIANTASSNSFFGDESGLVNTTGSRNSFFGRRSAVSNTTGSQNSFFGDSSGLNNTLGSDNSFFGASSGFGNTTGFHNSFFGVSSGLANSTGGNNSFFGASSGSGNTTGSNNSFFGSSSGSGNTTGFFNAFFGADSGLSNTVGTRNSIFGYRAGFDNTTGSENSFFGTQSGFNNVGGVENSFFGYQSGSSNTEGQFNSFFGRRSGESNTDGESNNVLGHNGLIKNISGSENISIGNNSANVDNLAVNVTSVNQSIFLGNNTKPLANGGTNEVVIGYNAVGNGSNTITLGNTSNVRTYNKGVNNVSNAYTVTTLPTGVRGDVAYVTDANFISYRATASGGGSDTALVFFDGTNWIYH